jgi:hypothetical protein
VGHALDEVEPARSAGRFVQDPAMGDAEETIPHAVDHGHRQVDPADS